MTESYGVSRKINRGATLYYVVREGLAEGLIYKGWKETSHAMSWEDSVPGKRASSSEVGMSLPACSRHRKEATWNEVRLERLAGKEEAR